MDYYSDTERQDADAITSIEQTVFNEVSKWEECYRVLLEMFQRIPADYQNQFEQDGLLYMKFWDEDEYQWFLQIAAGDNHVEPLPNAYPRCCYLLSVILIEQGQQEEALSVLAKGLELELGHPLLLSQLGMLECQMGRTLGDQTVLKTAFSRYEKAFDSRPHNTPAQKARALRGMGYTCIELGEWGQAEKYYEASLTWQESDNARNELNLIQSKKENPDEVISVAGSGFDKAQRSDSYTSFWEKQQKLPKFLQESLPDIYVYIWTKAAILCRVGPESYRNDDHFNYPLEDWQLKQITTGSFQIAQYLKGIHPDHALEGLSDSGFAQLLKTFHFDAEKEEVIRNSANWPIKKTWFRHVMDQSTIELYRSTSEPVVKPWWKIW